MPLSSITERRFKSTSFYLQTSWWCLRSSLIFETKSLSVRNWRDEMWGVVACSVGTELQSYRMWTFWESVRQLCSCGWQHCTVHLEIVGKGDLIRVFFATIKKRLSNTLPKSIDELYLVIQNTSLKSNPHPIMEIRIILPDTYNAVSERKYDK